MTREALRSPALLIGLVVWAGSLALYLSTLAPTLTWGYKNIGVDGGELLASANTLGIPHPPGYPTYMLLLKVFATVVPVGDYAHRGNLLSAVLASASVVLLYSVILRFCRFLRPSGPKALWIASGAVGASVLATSSLFWSQAVITEVYTLNSVFVGALLLIAAHLALPMIGDEVRERRSTTPWMALFGVVLGLGLGNHLTLLAVAVPLLFWLWMSLGWRRLASPWIAGALVLGLLIYVYMPIRAAQNPPINWGDADTLGGMGWMLSGRVYQDYVFGVPAGTIPARIVSWLELIFTQLNPLGLFLGVMGAVRLRFRQLWFLAATLASIAVLSVYSGTYNTVDFEVLMLPTFMLFSVWVGIGFLWILSSFSDWAREARGSLRFATLRSALSHPLPILTVIALGALPLSSVILNYRSQDRSGDLEAYNYARDIRNSAPDGSVLLSNDEGAAFAIWYMRYVEETDWDVAPVAVPLLQFDWYRRNIHQRYPERITAELPEDFTKALARIVEDNHGHSPVFFTYKDDFIDESFELERVGILYQARPKANP